MLEFNIRNKEVIIPFIAEALVAALYFTNYQRVAGKLHRLMFLVRSTFMIAF